MAREETRAMMRAALQSIRQYGSLGFVAGAGLALAIAIIVLWLGSGPGVFELRLSSGTPGGTYHSFATQLAKAVNARSSILRLSVLNSAGANQNAERLATRAAELGLIQSDTILNRNSAIAARLFPEILHLIARRDAGIASIPDLKGKRVALLPHGSGGNALFTRLLQHYELSDNDVTELHGSLREGEEALKTGKADALFIVIALGNKAIENLIEEANVTLVPIEQAEALAMFDPALRATTIPVGAYSGRVPVPAHSISVIAVDSFLAVRRDVPDAAVEELMRVLFGDRQLLVRQIPQAAFIGQPTAENRLSFDVHPGAQRYYNQDQPPFFVTYAEPMALGLSLLVLLVSGAWQARAWLAGVRKNRADHYNLALIPIVKRAEMASSLPELQAMRTELFGIFEQVLVDLDNDRIDERSLQAFSFAWEVANSTLNHRELMLTRGS
jgi:TRAP transporter TAXI family solute receptor